MNGNNVGLRIVAALVLVAAIAGIAYFAFQAGVVRGSPITIEAPSGEQVPAPYPYYGYGYGMPFHRPFGFGFGFFGFLLLLFLFFVPLLLKPGQLYVLATLVGCAGFVVLSHHYGVEVEVAAFTSIGITMVLRVLAIRLNWRTTPFGARWRRRDGAGSGGQD